jgi:hypothetical protein
MSMNIEVGQRWRDKDSRVTNRYCTVERVESPYVYIVRDPRNRPGAKGTRSRVLMVNLKRRFTLVG